MSVRKSKQDPQIRDFVIQNVGQHPVNIVPFAVEKLGVPRATVNRYVNRLVKDGVLEAVGATRARRYSLRNIQTELFHIELNDKKFSEDAILRETVFAQLGDIPQNIRDILWVGGNEMINNVLDHSNAKHLDIDFGRNAAGVWMRIYDDGVGVFEKIRKEFNLLDARHALLELSKGKLTTAKKEHSGEGIFFTSRMFTTFMLNSRGLVFMRKMEESDGWLFEDKEFRGFL